MRNASASSASSSMASSSDAPGIPFAVVQVRELRHAASVIAWNPAIDLVAVGSAEGRTLTCLRPMSWEKVWEVGPFPEGEAPSACCWRPDGRALAYGDAAGRVRVLSAEDGIELCVSWHPTHDGPVRSLDWGGEAWADESFAVGNPLFEADALVRMFGPDGAQDYDDRTPQMFPKLLLEAVGTGPTAGAQVVEGAPAVATAASTSAGGQAQTREADGAGDEAEVRARRRWAPIKGMRLFWDACPTRLSVLVSGGEDGHVGVSLFGVYSIARVDVGARLVSRHLLSNAAVPSVHEVKLAHGLGGVSCGVVDEEAGTAFLVVIPLNELRAREKELACGTHMALRGRTLAGYLAFHARQARALVRLVHEDIHQALVAPLAALADDHGDYAPGAGPGAGEWARVCGLLGALCVVGAMPLSVRSFLTTSLQDDKVKRLGRKLTQHIADLQGVLFNRLQPASEALLFQMSELADFSFYAESLCDLDVEPEGYLLCEERKSVTVCALEDATLLVQLIDRIQAMTTRSAECTTHFVRWLARNSALANAEEGVAHGQPKLAQPAGEPAADYTKVMEFLDEAASGGPLARIESHFSTISIEQLEDDVLPRLGLVNEKSETRTYGGRTQIGGDGSDSPVLFFPQAERIENATFGGLLLGATGHLHRVANWVLGTLASEASKPGQQLPADVEIIASGTGSKVGMSLQNVPLRDLGEVEAPTWEGSHIFPELERPLDPDIADTLDNTRRRARLKGPYISVAAMQVSENTCCVVRYHSEGGSEGFMRRPSWCVIKFPRGRTLLGLQLYKPGLVALVHGEAVNAKSSNPTVTLLTFTYEDAEFAPLPEGFGLDSVRDLAMLAREVDAVEVGDNADNSREIFAQVCSFHTGPERGMASLLSDEGFQIHVLDMEDEEDSDVEDADGD